MIAVLIAIIAAGSLIVILMAVTGGKKSDKDVVKVTSKKNHGAIIKECTKKLSKDPHNIEALKSIADVFYAEQNYEKAYPYYQTLFRLMAMHVEIDQQYAASRLGLCAYKLSKYEESLEGYGKVLRMNPKDYEANLYVGKIMYQKKEYEKAILCLRRAAAIQPESSEIYESLGMALYQSKKYKESLPFLKKALDEAPDNKEMLFLFASAMEETGLGEKALKIFMHLRTDPQFGPQSCIACGSYHQKIKQSDKAIQDYEIALKLESITPEMRLSCCYKLSQVYLAQHDIAKALSYLKQIQIESPNYKDVNVLVSRYQELNQNANLQLYLMSGTSDFVVLCRKFVASFYPDAFVKIEDVNVATESIEIICSVDAGKWNDTELFRFFRSSGAIGELYIRDFHSKIRDIKCDKGFCVTAGSFTDEARKYVENRPIDLIEKNKLISVLKRIEN